MLMGKLWERYLLWRLTPAEQLLYRALKRPEEWDTARSNYFIRHTRTHVECWTGDASDASRWIAFRIEAPGLNDRVVPRRFVRKILHRMARDIKYPPPPNKRVLQKKLFEHLMRAELGEKP